MKQRETGILHTGNKKVDYVSPKHDDRAIENIGREIMGRNWRKTWLEKRTQAILINNCIANIN